MTELMDEYNTLMKKFGLPEYSKLQSEFSISKIDEEPILLDIISKIDDRIEFLLKTLNRILQPDTVIADMHESSTFTEDEKKEIFELYKKLMIMHDDAVILMIESDEKAESRFIQETMKDWPDLKSSVAVIVRKMRDSWKQDVDLKEDIGYMG